MKILVLRVTNRSRHRKCFVRGLYSVTFTRLCQKPSLVQVFTQTAREYNPVRRTFYDVNYIHIQHISKSRGFKSTSSATVLVTHFTAMISLRRSLSNHDEDGDKNVTN